MTFQAHIAGSQIDGARDYQEDAFLITHLQGNKNQISSLIIVADGMGGHAAGNVASNMAVQAFNKHVSANYLKEETSTVLNESILKANGSLTETIKETSALGGMGCTMVCALIEQGHLWWASVGDSHLYLLRERKLTKLNADHSYGGFLDRMEAAGTPIKPEKGLSRNMLMSAITGDDIPEIDCPTTPFILKHGDRLVICTDGLDTLSEGKIVQYTDWADNSKECSESLLSAVEEAGYPKQDNTTVVVAMVEDDGVNVATKDGAADELDDDEDITEPQGAKKTAKSASETQQTTATRTQPVTLETNVIQDKPKSKIGLIFGIAATLLVLAGGGYFFVLSTSKPDRTVSTVTTDLKPEVELEKGKPADTASPAPPASTSIPETAPAKKVPTDKKTVASAPEKAPAIIKQEQPAIATTEKKEIQDKLKDGSNAPLMMVMPSGSFEMGSPASSRFAEERPRHKVNISSFSVSKYEITVADYTKFAKATNRKLPKKALANKPQYPITYVKWDDAYNYVKWLKQQTGKKYRLLSESEWEYIGSTGKKSAFWWGYDESSGKAHCFGCDSGLDPRAPAKVGFFEANDFGVHDTAGNVAEWVRDCWHRNYQGAPTDNEVWEGGDCAYRVVRGGGFASPQQSIRSAKRDRLKSDLGYEHVGIRIARDLD